MLEVEEEKKGTFFAFFKLNRKVTKARRSILNFVRKYEHLFCSLFCFHCDFIYGRLLVLNSPVPLIFGSGTKKFVSFLNIPFRLFTPVLTSNIHRLRYCWQKSAYYATFFTPFWTWCSLFKFHETKTNGCSFLINAENRKVTISFSPRILINLLTIRIRNQNNFFSF